MLHYITEHPDSISVKLGMMWDNKRTVVSGDLEMTIKDNDASRIFKGMVGSPWKVTLERADGDHEGCPYTG